MEIPSLLRLEEHKAISAITLNGSILDIGGDTYSAYRKLVQGSHTFTTINLNEKVAPDIFHDLEKPLPCADASFDHVMLINVLEHIFNFEQLLKESARVLKTRGQIVVVVPFLFPVHPSPKDFYRYTYMTLEQELEKLGFKSISVKALGTGVFSAQYVLLDRLMPKPIRLISYWTIRYIAQLADKLFTKLSKILKKKYNPEDYALGYCVTGTK